MNGEQKAEVLIVEDEKDTRCAMRELLDLYGFSVAEASNGLEALEYLRRGARPSIILLDLMMPVMDGLQFREQQLRDPALANIPVIAVCSFWPSGPRHLAVQKIFRKPIDVGALLEALGTHRASHKSVGHSH